MHIIAPYILKCYDPTINKSHEDRHVMLDKIKTNTDLFALIKNFMTTRTDFTLIESEKQVYRFSSMKYLTSTRVICGWFQVGKYGRKTDIINIETGEVDFEKTTDNAEIINHFIYLKIPKNVNEGIALLHSTGLGVKTLFHSLLREEIDSKTKVKLMMEPLSSQKAMKKWHKAVVKEIKLVGFKKLGDKADVISQLGHKEQILTLKPERSKCLGILEEFFNKNSGKAKIVATLNADCTTVKSTVELNGKKRTFSIGNNPSNSICEIEEPDDLKIKDGNPVYNSIEAWCQGICKDFMSEMYNEGYV